MAAKALMSNLSPKNWRDIYNSYATVLEQKAKAKTTLNASKELIDLDRWYQEQLPTAINSRPEQYINHSELVKLMKWKLNRGKFRPRLVELASSNEENVIIETTKGAFKLLENGDKIEEAIAAASKLKGIGPATASAILAAGCPAKAAFMADESVWGVLGQRSLRYDVKEYMDYMAEINRFTRQLHSEDPEFDWTPHKVELATWARYHSSQGSGFDNNSIGEKKRKFEDSTLKGSEKEQSKKTPKNNR